VRGSWSRILRLLYWAEGGGSRSSPMGCERDEAVVALVHAQAIGRDSMRWYLLLCRCRLEATDSKPHGKEAAGAEKGSCRGSVVHLGAQIVG